MQNWSVKVLGISCQPSLVGFRQRVLLPVPQPTSKNGGRTPVAGMVHAFTLLLILLFLMPYASLIPMTCLASILMIVGYNMSGWRTVGRMIKRAPKSDVAVLLVTFVLTVFL